MWQTLISGLLALLGVLLGGVAAHLLAVRRERETREDARRAKAAALHREKGEELYALVTEWSHCGVSNGTPFMHACFGKLTLEEASKQRAAGFSEPKADFERIEMLIDVYFPAARELYASFTFDLSQLRNMECDLEYAARSGEERDAAMLLEYESTFEGFRDAAEELKRCIRDELRKYGEE